MSKGIRTWNLSFKCLISDFPFKLGFIPAKFRAVIKKLTFFYYGKEEGASVLVVGIWEQHDAVIPTLGLKFPNTHQLGELGGPRVGGDDSLFRDPVFVHGTQRLDGHLTFGGFVPADQNTVGLFQIPHRRSFSQELWVGQDLDRQQKQWTDEWLL